MFGLTELFGQTSTDWISPNDRTFFCRTQKFSKCNELALIFPKQSSQKIHQKKKIQEKSKKYKQFPNSLILKIYSSLHRIWRPKTLSGLFFTTYCIFQNGYLRYFKLERKLKLFCGDNFRQN
jgi:hypothetical protein